MSVSYPNTQCDALWNQMYTEIDSWSGGGPSGGIYDLYEWQEWSYIWSTRLTLDRQYTDDQIFEFTQNGTTCDVAARSQSESPSYYDYDVNYCNMWNVFNGISPIIVNMQVTECPFEPTDPATTCQRY